MLELIEEMTFERLPRVCLFMEGLDSSLQIEMRAFVIETVQAMKFRFPGASIESLELLQEELIDILHKKLLAQIV